MEPCSGTLRGAVTTTAPTRPYIPPRLVVVCPLPPPMLRVGAYPQAPTHSYPEPAPGYACTFSRVVLCPRAACARCSWLSAHACKASRRGAVTASSAVLTNPEVFRSTQPGRRIGVRRSVSCMSSLPEASSRRMPTSLPSSLHIVCDIGHGVLASMTLSIFARGGMVQPCRDFSLVLPEREVC